jgi:hypothetical protein
LFSPPFPALILARIGTNGHKHAFKDAKIPQQKQYNQYVADGGNNEQGTKDFKDFSVTRFISISHDIISPIRITKNLAPPAVYHSALGQGSLSVLHK